MTRQEEIETRTIDLLLDKGTLAKVEMTDVKSFAFLLYHSERLAALGKDRNGNTKTEAHLLALQYLNITEDEILNSISI